MVVDILLNVYYVQAWSPPTTTLTCFMLTVSLSEAVLCTFFGGGNRGVMRSDNICVRLSSF